MNFSIATFNAENLDFRARDKALFARRTPQVAEDLPEARQGADDLEQTHDG